MEFLKAEINRKRKINETLHQKLTNNSNDGSEVTAIPTKAKFIRVSDRLKEEQSELLKKQEEINQIRIQRQQEITKTQNISNEKQLKPEIKEREEVKQQEEEKQQRLEQLETTLSKLSENEIKLKLRFYRQPITFFGEDFNHRLKRLLLIITKKINNEINEITSTIDNEYRVGRNASIDELEEAELDEDDKIDQQNTQLVLGHTNTDEGEVSEEEGKGETGIDTGLKWDPSIHFTKMENLSSEKIIYKFFRSLLKQWESDLNIRDDNEKRTAKGKLETRTQKQCKDHIRPLFRMLKSKQVPFDILEKLLKMVEYAENGNFVAANDQYMIAAIGKAAWPIGLTMVGIHERSGREKISTSKVAHVMNNELERKYLTSVKRLLTFAQSKRTDIPPSMKVLTR